LYSDNFLGFSVSTAVAWTELDFSVFDTLLREKSVRPFGRKFGYFSLVCVVPP
jgi:hypothetical protein